MFRPYCHTGVDREEGREPVYVMMGERDSTKTRTDRKLPGDYLAWSFLVMA